MDTDSDPRRWFVLGVGMAAMVAACAFQYGLPFLVPRLLADGLSLSQAGVVVSAPLFGVMSSLVLWGMAADRFGERLVLGAGLGGAGLALFGAASAGGVHGLVAWLAAAGASGAAVHAASGRLILGWFSAHERGLAMGARQMAQPLGVALAALVVPRLAASGVGLTMSVLAAACLVAALLAAVGARDPGRTAADSVRDVSPYRTPYLWRLHGVGTLLVVPQFVVSAFAFDYLVRGQGWGAATAGGLLAAVQLVGAGSRLGLGWFSDRTGSRLRPLRVVALGTGTAMLALALGAVTSSVLAVVALLLSAVMSSSPNGLTFTAVAERAGRAWAGRALGIHNTGQNATATATAPLGALLLTALGAGAGTGSGHGGAYAVTFAVAAVPAFVAALAIPIGDEEISEPAGLTASRSPSAR